MWRYILFGQLLIATSLVSADGDIGCAFSEVCSPTEQCIDDNLFGICMSADVLALGIIPNLSIQPTDEQNAVLSRYLQSLATKGYSWRDDETQCVMKWIVESLKGNEPTDTPACLALVDEVQPDQEQKRVSESLAHAFQSYNGPQNDELIREKYLRMKSDMANEERLARLARYLSGRSSSIIIDSNKASILPNSAFFSDNINDGIGVDSAYFIGNNDGGEGKGLNLVVIPDNDDASGNIPPEFVVSPYKISKGVYDSEINRNEDLIPVVISDDDRDIPFDVSEFPLPRTGGLAPDIYQGSRQFYDYQRDDKPSIKGVFEEMMADSQVNNDLLNDFRGQFQHPQSLSSKSSSSSDGKSESIEAIETNYAYIETEPKIESVSQASAFLECATDQLSKQFADCILILDSWHDAVVFEVRDPSGEITASSLAKQIESNADKINIACRYRVRSVGIGRRSHLSVYEQKEALAQTSVAAGSQSRWSVSHTVIVTIIVLASACIAGSVVVLILLRLASRRGSLKNALGSVQGRFRDWKNRKFYEDLCRESISVKAACSAKCPEAVNSGDARSSTPPPSPPPWAEEPRPTDLDVSTAHVVLAYMEEHLKNRSRLDEEWGELCGYAPDRSDLSIAHLAENSNKNRDMNFVPYDHNRVKLCSEANASKSDYINASHIVDTDPRRPAYVVTQTPLAETVPDFWQLVWEQKSTLVVFLGQPNEPKSVRYWPQEGLALYHRWQVGLVSEHAWNEDFVVRSLVLKDTATGDSRTVTQFHFLAWANDHVPKLCRSILAFRRKANRSYRPHASPIIIQSTHGGGRAGAYILLDMTLNHIAKGAREVDIAASLEHLRDQRTGLVKTKEQFEFVLICVAEEIAAIVKSSREGSGNSSPQ